MRKQRHKSTKVGKYSFKWKDNQNIAITYKHTKSRKKITFLASTTKTIISLEQWETLKKRNRNQRPFIVWGNIYLHDEFDYLKMNMVPHYGTTIRIGYGQNNETLGRCPIHFSPLLPISIRLEIWRKNKVFITKFLLIENTEAKGIISFEFQYS